MRYRGLHEANRFARINFSLSYFAKFLHTDVTNREPYLLKSFIFKRC